MMYCVRCGDRIDKGELVCNKCGLKFNIVTDKGTYVYVNQPVPKAKPKKKRGWIVALVILLITTIMLSCCGISTLFTGFIGLVWLLDDEDYIEPVVVDNTDGSIDYTQPINNAYNSADFGPSDNYFEGVIRDQYVNIKGDGSDTVTVMVYMNGSDLESKNGFASSDLSEMLNARITDKMNVVVQTGGTKKWKTKGISSKHSQRFLVQNGQLVLIDDTLDQLDITNPDTLEDFISYCSTNYPANRNILIMWDHGGGVVYGFGSDENVDDYQAALTLDEIQDAIENAGVKFEMIGFDACLMGGIETVCALSDVCDYLVVSEDFEPGYGWEYQNWLTLLANDTSAPISAYGKVIVDDFVVESNSAGGDGVLAVIDQRYARLLYKAWTDFAYAEKDNLITHNYGMEFTKSNRALPSRFGEYGSDERFGELFDAFMEWYTQTNSMENYCYAVDIMALASTMSSTESKALSSALSSAVCYCSTTAGDSNLTGLSVTLPYGDNEFYGELVNVFTNCGFDSKYITYLEQFAVATTDTNYDWKGYDYNGWDDYDDYYDWNSYDGWDDYVNEDYGWDNYNYDSEWYDEDENIFGDFGYFDPVYGTIYFEEDGTAYYYDEEEDAYYYVDDSYYDYLYSDEYYEDYYNALYGE